MGDRPRGRAFWRLTGIAPPALPLFRFDRMRMVSSRGRPWRQTRLDLLAQGEAQDGQIELINKLAQKAGRVIGRPPVLQGGREKERRSVIRSDRLSQTELDDQSNKLFNKKW
jgi:hypothetical protein